MLPKRVMHLPNWGDGPAAAFKPGQTFAVSLGEVIIQRVIPAPRGYLGIAGVHNEKAAIYNVGPLDEKTLRKVAKIVEDNKGNTLLSIGTIEIPPDED